MNEPEERAPPSIVAPPPRTRRMRRSTRLLLLAVLNLAFFSICGLGLEFALRWYREGGPIAALRSLKHGSYAPSQSTGAEWFIYDEELGYRLNPAQPAINQQGIRHAEIAREKPAGERRLFFVGDSVGWSEGGFVDLLRERLTRAADSHVLAVNASVPGYTTWQERILLERELLPLRPDLVVLQYCINDNHRFLHHLTDDHRWLMTEEARQALVPGGDGWFESLTRASYLVLTLRMQLMEPRKDADDVFPWRSTPSIGAAWREETWPMIDEQVLAMQRGLAGVGGRLAVVAFPSLSQLNPAAAQRDRDYTFFPQRQLAAICTRAKLPFFDLAPTLGAVTPTAKLFKDDLHLTPRGHGVAAEAIHDFLLRERLIE